MMRLLCGTVVQVGNGTLSVEGFENIWRNELRHKVNTGLPPSGLVLLQVQHHEDLWEGQSFRPSFPLWERR